MATLYEFTPNGIKFLGFQNIRSQIQELWTQVFGEELDYSPTSPDGHHLDLECKVINSISELLQTICSNLNRSTATGEFLEFLCAFVGISRSAGETDASLRKRAENAFTDGLATENGMITYLKEKVTPGLSLKVNAEDRPDEDNVPAHSFRVTVPESYHHETEEGEDDTADWIAQKIFECKPAGISSTGNSVGTAVDIVGGSHNEHYSIPTSVLIDVKIEITKYSEEAFPTDGENLIKSAIVEWGLNEYVPGKDVIPLRLCTPLFSVPGIEQPEISVKKHSDLDWSSSKIAISSEQNAVVNFENIEIIIE